MPLMGSHAADVERQNIGLAGAAGVTALDGGSDVGAGGMAEAIGRTSAWGVDRVVAETVQSVAGGSTGKLSGAE